MTTFDKYDHLPGPIRAKLNDLADFIGDCDGKSTFIETDGDTVIDDGTIDAEEAVQAFNFLVAVLAPSCAGGAVTEAEVKAAARAIRKEFYADGSAQQMARAALEAAAAVRPAAESDMALKQACQAVLATAAAIESDAMHVKVPREVVGQLRAALAARPADGWQYGDERCDDCDNGVATAWNWCPWCGADLMPQRATPLKSVSDK